jgi:uncharacterized repeat protein (TIGR03847 family)
MPVIAYDMPERFVAGTVGQPGDRAFFLQARAGRRVTSVGLEKFQVTLLAERLEELLDEVLRQSGGDSEAVVPAVAPVELQDDEPLEQPIEEEFRVGTMALAWDPDDERVVIEAQEVTEGEDEETEIGSEDPAVVVLRVRISAGQARAFSERALKIVAAGRPPCPLCGLPLDTQGHVCPRQNGHLG